MTAIAACVSRSGRIWLGGDRAFSGESAHVLQGEPKVRRIGGVVIGAAGDQIGSDLLYRLDAPEQPDANWMRFGLAASLRQLSREIGWEPDEDARDWLAGGAGSLWYIDGNFATSALGRYAAIGSGEPHCLAVLYDRRRRLGRSAVDAALAAAAEHTRDVAEPFDILSV